MVFGKFGTSLRRLREGQRLYPSADARGGHPSDVGVPRFEEPQESPRIGFPERSTSHKGARSPGGGTHG